MLSLFQSAFLQKISHLIISNEEIYNNLLQNINKEPKTLEEYIEIKTYITSHTFKTTRNHMIEDIKALRTCIDLLTEFLINIEENLLQISLEAFIWPSKISRFRKIAKEKLNEMKPKFLRILEEKNMVLKEKFGGFKAEIEKFNQYYDLNEAFHVCQIAKEIVFGLKNVILSAKKINEQETFLNFNISDFEEFEICLAEFDKFHLLWDFAEKWKFVRN